MLKVECAWCDKVIALEERGDGIRYLVCDDCRAEMFKKIHTSISGPRFRPFEYLFRNRRSE
jgi:hypothetical protein